MVASQGEAFPGVHLDTVNEAYNPDLQFSNRAQFLGIGYPLSAYHKAPESSSALEAVILIIQAALSNKVGGWWLAVGRVLSAQCLV